MITSYFEFWCFKHRRICTEKKSSIGCIRKVDGRQAKGKETMGKLTLITRIVSYEYIQFSCYHRNKNKIDILISVI